MPRKKTSTTKRQPVRRLQVSIWGGRTLRFTWSVTPRRKLTKKQQAARQKRRLQSSLFLVLYGAVGLIYFSVKVVAAALPDNTLPKVQLVTPYRAQTVAALPAATPLHINIPGIAVDAEIMQVNRLPDGSLEVPNNGGQVGYYGQGPTPGELGPAVLVGHVDTYTGPAVFARLQELQPGDMVSVSRKDGTVARFRITRVQSFDQNNFPTDAVYGNIDHAGLRLITCGGSFNLLSQRYSHNTVVFAMLVY